MASDEMFGQFMHLYPVKHQENTDSFSNKQQQARKCVFANPDPCTRATTAENEAREDKDLECQNNNKTACSSNGTKFHKIRD